MKLSRNWAFLALLSFLGAMGILSGQRLYVCSGDQVARTFCCCPERPLGGPDQLALSSPCCCDTVQVAPASAPSEPARKVASLSRAAQLLLADVGLIVAGPDGRHDSWSRHSALTAFATRPPPIPVLLRKQSFLI